MNMTVEQGQHRVKLPALFIYIIEIEIFSTQVCLKQQKINQLINLSAPITQIQEMITQNFNLYYKTNSKYKKQSAKVT